MYFKPYQFGSKEFVGLTLTSKSQKQRWKSKGTTSILYLIHIAFFKDTNVGFWFKTSKKGSHD
ncbi:hypothetical protein HanXRQr2_Chr08g0326601 [Helianthus annuus]|uniref:Uncharacterized protein n=1 Tax=Helianthus annuus TaxID=4232 RepID=A0A9K3ID02_HELAN|nr:hypothetical protein HanXRQr2_Chr08g0326601 [Helianthus annuus]